MTTKHISDKKFECRMYKELLKLSKKTNNPIQNWENYLNNYFTKEAIRIVNYYSISLVITKLHIKTIMRCLIPRHI